VAILATVFVSRIHAATAGVTDALAQSVLSGYQAAFLVGSVLVAFAALSGRLIHGEDAASACGATPRTAAYRNPLRDCERRTKDARGSHIISGLNRGGCDAIDAVFNA